MLSEPPDAPPEPLRLLYRDESLVVIDKPSGLLVHRSIVDARERRFAVQQLRDQIGQRVYPAHRLDKGTSGALAFALDAAGARALAGQFASGRVCKHYVAIVRGWPLEHGEIDVPLSGVEDALLPSRTGTQPALTQYRRLATVELPLRVDRYPSSRYALLDLTPHTGRRHQLRRHLAHISHPIIGDSTYGKGSHNRLFRERYASHRLLLACTELGFEHPRDRRPITVFAPLGDQFAVLIEEFGWTASLPAQWRGPDSRVELSIAR